MTSDEKDDLLDRYVTGQAVSAAEEALVGQLLTTDPDFRNDYRLRRELFEAGKRERRAAWEARQTVRPLPVPVQPSVFPMRWAAAASVVLLMGLGLFWWLQMSPGQPLTGQAAVFEPGATQLGLTGSDSAAVGTVTWVLTRSETSRYEFEQPDTLRVFTASPAQWADSTWQLIRLSEVRYQLRVGHKTYLIQQGRAGQLPLLPEK